MGLSASTAASASCSSSLSSSSRPPVACEECSSASSASSSSARAKPIAQSVCQWLCDGLSAGALVQAAWMKESARATSLPIHTWHWPPVRSAARGSIHNCVTSRARPPAAGTNGTAGGALFPPPAPGLNKIKLDVPRAGGQFLSRRALWFLLLRRRELCTRQLLIYWSRSSSLYPSTHPPSAIALGFFKRADRDFPGAALAARYTVDCDICENKPHRRGKWDWRIRKFSWKYCSVNVCRRKHKTQGKLD